MTSARFQYLLQCLDVFTECVMFSWLIVLFLLHHGNQTPLLRIEVKNYDEDLSRIISPANFSMKGQSARRNTDEISPETTTTSELLNTDVVTETEQQNTTEDFQTTSDGSNEETIKRKQWDELGTTTDDLLEEESTVQSNLTEKSINNSSSKSQVLLDPVSWTGPAVRTQSVKTKANWTTTVLNGVAVHTDISVYQSHGRSYQFRIPGGLPEKIPGGIIAWIRTNSHRYPQTEIQYCEYGSDVEKHATPPKELPLRCGTKFLDKLSGGKVTPIEENPWQVAVLRREFQSYVCGGAVITRRHVISAAHCFRGKRSRYTPADILLRVGDYDKEVREESQVDYSVVELVIHEDYHAKSHIHDIALLTTNEDIPFSSHIYPICLPPSWAEYSPGMECTVSGWGQVGEEKAPTRYLRSGQVTIISREECRKKTIFSRGVPQEVFCAEDPTRRGVDTCLGDSGGPFACSQNGTFYLYGITAFGSYPCGQDVPSFYTNVSFYKIWILQVLSRSNT